MQQWRELPQEMTGRRKGAKKVEDGGIAITVDASDAAEVAAGGECAETELFCEACRKWFKSEQQMCDCVEAFILLLHCFSWIPLSLHATAHCVEKTQGEAAGMGGTSRSIMCGFWREKR